MNPWCALPGSRALCFGRRLQSQTTTDIPVPDGDADGGCWELKHAWPSKWCRRRMMKLFARVGAQAPRRSNAHLALGSPAWAAVGGRHHVMGKTSRVWTLCPDDCRVVVFHAFHDRRSEFHRRELRAGLPGQRNIPVCGFPGLANESHSHCSCSVDWPD